MKITDFSFILRERICPHIQRLANHVFPGTVTTHARRLVQNNNQHQTRMLEDSTTGYGKKILRTWKTHYLSLIMDERIAPKTPQIFKKLEEATKLLPTRDVTVIQCANSLKHLRLQLINILGT